MEDKNTTGFHTFEASSYNLFMKTLALAFIILLSLGSQAQKPNYYFQQTDTVPVFRQGDQLENPWAGGTNNAQFNHIDLNQDQVLDLLVFDRDGYRLMPFLHTGNPGDQKWKYAPEYIKDFPEFREWMVTVDYNNDGKMDIFTHASAGIIVFLNESQPGSGLKFTKVTPGLLNTNYGSPNDINLYVSSVDIPAIADIDNDGDIDILTFGILGGYVEYHQNQSMENYGVPDSLDFQMVDGCFGDFIEDFSTNNVSLDTCVNNDTCTAMQRDYPLTGTAESGGGAHAGSTILATDLDGDQDMELILGDISFDNLIKLNNGGCPEYADMDAVEEDFPQSDVEVHIPIFPAAYRVDVNRDGIRDLVVAPNATNISLNYNCNWLYLNSGTDQVPVFSRSQTDFLQDGMIEHGSRVVPVMADLSGDGLPDLIIGNYGYYQTSGNYTSQLAYYKNTGTLTQPEFTYVTDDLGGLSQITAFPFSLHPALADLDNDQDLDMIIGDSDGKLHRFENTGSGSNPNFVLTEPNMGGIDVGSAASPVLYDFGNGVFDLVVGDRNGNLHYIPNNGSINSPSFTSVTNSNFGNVNVISPVFSVGHAVPNFVEINGSTVLFIGNFDGQVFTFTDIDNNLSGSFKAQDTLFDGKTNGGYSAPFAIDLNQDGWVELILGNKTGGLEFFTGLDTNKIGLVENLQSFDFSVFPNPASSEVQIQTSSYQSGFLSVRGIDGRALKSLPFQGFEVNLNLIDFPKGIYLIELETQEGRSVQKLVIQ